MQRSEFKLMFVGRRACSVGYQRSLVSNFPELKIDFRGIQRLLPLRLGLASLTLVCLYESEMPVDASLDTASRGLEGSTWCT